MNILITGSNGQLGSEIKSLSSLFSEHSFFFTDVGDLDITNAEAIGAYIAENKIDTLINCAAYTAVDKAEEESDLARLINVEAVKNLAEATSSAGTLLIHISTDYVFDGKNHRPYVEDDKTNPQSVYAETKLDAEKMVEKYASKGVVVRTSWLYSSFGYNFVKTMMKFGKERENLNVIFDQIGTPTYARDLAKTIITIIDNGTILNKHRKILSCSLLRKFHRVWPLFLFAGSQRLYIQALWDLCQVQGMKTHFHLPRIQTQRK